MANPRKYSFIGVASFVIGIFNILITITISWTLYSLLNEKYGEYLLVQSKIMHFGNLTETFTKPLGLILGVVGLFFKKKNRLFAILGTIINALVILWTVGLMLGFFF